MTDDQKTPETEEPTPATEGEQDVEGHKIAPSRRSPARARWRHR